MKLRARHILFSSWLLVCLSFMAGCASEGMSGVDSTSAVLRGMVYNENRAPVQDVTVRLEDKGTTVATARSDIHGRFFLPKVAYGKVTLKFSKPDYEPLSWTFSFDHPTQVVYVKMYDLSELLDDAAADIRKRDWSSASALLGRIHSLESGNTVASYLEAVMLARQGKAGRAAVLLEKLSADNGSFFAVELTLADLYQYTLGQPDKAVEHLKKALTIQDDIDVENRIAALENAGGQNR